MPWLADGASTSVLQAIRSDAFLRAVSQVRSLRANSFVMERLQVSLGQPVISSCTIQECGKHFGETQAAADPIEVQDTISPTAAVVGNGVPEASATETGALGLGWRP